MSLPLTEKIPLPHDMVIFPNHVFGETAGGFETITAGGFELIRSPKNGNPKSIRNGLISFLGAVFGKTAGCSYPGGYHVPLLWEVPTVGAKTKGFSSLGIHAGELSQFTAYTYEERYCHGKPSQSSPVGGGRNYTNHQ